MAAWSFDATTLASQSSDSGPTNRAMRAGQRRGTPHRGGGTVQLPSVGAGPLLQLPSGPDHGRGIRCIHQSAQPRADPCGAGLGGDDRQLSEHFGAARLGVRAQEFDRRVRLGVAEQVHELRPPNHRAFVVDDAHAAAQPPGELLGPQDESPARR
jgi:hypothetical protein